MTREQREILLENVRQDGNEYSIRTIEYPCTVGGFGLESCLKIVTQMSESEEMFVDYYNEQGATIQTRRFFRREAQ